MRATFCSSVLVMEAIVLVFFGLGVYNLNRGDAMAPWALGLALLLALVAVLDCALVTRPLGIAIGWAIQVALVAGMFLEYTMVIVAAGFGLAWWYAVTKGGELDRVNRARAAAEARWRAEHPEQA